MNPPRVARVESLEEAPSTPAVKARQKKYIVDEQVGFILRQVNQRHTSLFADEFDDDLTPTQWTALCKLSEVGPLSQNSLGRATAMDVATIKGVVDRLMRRKLVKLDANPNDARQLIVALTTAGQEIVAAHLQDAHLVTERTLAPLTQQEVKTFLALLRKLRW